MSQTRGFLAPFLAAVIVLTVTPALAVEDGRSVVNEALTLLEAHCVQCHGGKSTKGGLNLVTREALLSGGDGGTGLVPGKPDDSLIIKSIRHETDAPMPHKARKLSDGSIATLSAWVAAGAPYPRVLNKEGVQLKTEFAITDKDRSHWAFQPVKRPPLPLADDPSLSSAHPIDRFILAKLREIGLTLSPAAGREALIRRVKFDLVGLPPTPQEVAAFAADASPDAYEKLIDRYLASPHYGERWGRHWLDLARYAETDGFEHDAVRPHSWRYRDYVVRAFNADKPYDRFVLEQIAGDELWPTESDALIATGFNLLGPDMVDSADQVQRRQNTLNDMTDTTGLVFLGLTVGCARCHDHKFEPISQKDYYRLQASFTPVAFKRDLPVATPADREKLDSAMREWEQQSPVQELAKLDAPVIEKLRAAKIRKLSPEAQAAHAVAPERRDTEQANLVLETAHLVEVNDNAIGSAHSTDDRARRSNLKDQIKKLPKPPQPPMAMALSNGKGAATKTFVLNRGEYSQPTDEVSPGVMTVLAATPGDSSAADLPAAGRRSRLAQWMVDPANPLTARVMVNRIWQHHFGKGLVASASDFGVHGQQPSHPELLDWLASEFVARGWSVKQMHKLMLMSATYQQSTTPAADDVGKLTAADPGTQLYGRMNRLRLEGEIIRDSLLAISGRLNPEMGGPGVFPPIPKAVLKGAKGWEASKNLADHGRRSIYIFARRNLRFPFLEVFDAPNSNLSCPSRERSTTAPQSLTLLNAEDVMAAAKSLAERLEREAKTPEERIALAYKLTLGRAPTANELAISEEFVAAAPMSELCRALFNVNEFVYLE
ncbi:DUF1553 domain-containing protein [Humisphaera borealis]|uniref:PSD1 domain-containing protein n=1 Tax=Humisphaera borealis TaxID=2807512 RepID=A0A7M2WZB3_9BACT|nr:PSD1 and planctomycete cytochrome C domain-containing protein [Humisphaera borealis]QOV90704.1 PSD1 domain-containing protein [Humisphaera borealis]